MAKNIIKGIPNVFLALLVIAAVGWQQGWFGGLAVTGGQQPEGAGSSALGCYASGAATTNLLLSAYQSIPNTDGTIVWNGGSVQSYLTGATVPFETTTLGPSTAAASSTNDPGCGVAVRSVFLNTSTHLQEVSFSASRDPNTQVVFNADVIPTITVRGKNSTNTGVATSISVVGSASGTSTEASLQLQAATTHGVIWDPIACVQFNSTAFSSVEFLGKAEIPVPVRLVTPSTTNINGTIARHCYDLGLGKSVKDFGYSADLPLKIVTSSSFAYSPNINVTIMERAGYLLNGQIVVGAETNTFTRPTYSATDAYYTITVGSA